MAEPERRRRRPAVSCTLCRKRKIRCNRENPCSNCVRSKNECIFESHPPLPAFATRQLQSYGANPISVGPPGASSSLTSSGTSRVSRVPSDIAGTLADTSSSASSPLVEPATPWDVECLKSKIKKLELQIAKTSPKPSVDQAPSIETTYTSLAGTFHIRHENDVFGSADTVSRGIMHKSRLFGQSHWINGVAMFRDIFEILEPHIRMETSGVSTGVKKCKSLAKIIKARRAPSWPVTTNTPLPSKDVADDLVDCYLRTIETVYRVLHVPSFKKDYEAMWVSDTEPNSAFLIQVKLVLAIGATTYDDSFSLRSTAVKWVYEAQSWLSNPDWKSQLSTQGLQTHLLLLIARETANVGRDIWIPLGAVIRQAVYMGLHRDPTRLPKRTAFATEMRRRLWNTILELALQSSMASGGPPFLSLEDFDSLPPRNFDDEQLLTEDPIPKPESDLTETSVSIAFRKTYPIRYRITKFINDTGAGGTYEDTLRLHTELKTAYKEIRQTLQQGTSRTGFVPSQFALSVVDLLMRRYLSALHVPYFGPALSETTYAFSRQVVIENALSIWSAVYPSSSFVTRSVASINESSSQEDLYRLVVNGSGFFRTIAIQAVFLLEVEIRSQLRENEGLGLTPLRRDLLSVLEEATAWNLKCIESGETNMKGYLFQSIVMAQVLGIMRGVKKEDFGALLTKAAEDSVNVVLPILEAKVRESQTEATLEDFSPSAFYTTQDVMEDWDLTIADNQFYFDATDPMSWVFNDDQGGQELSFW